MTRGARSLGTWLGRSVRALLVVLGGAPLWTRAVHDVPVLGIAARGFDHWFAFQCHRDLGRSLSVMGSPMPVCVRCFGIYLGLGLGALFLRPRLGAVAARVWVGLAALVMVLDVLTESLGMRPEWVPLRVATGILLAYPVGVLLVLAARNVSAPASTER